MGRSKEYNYDNKTMELARIAKALGHPARIEILKVLIRRNACVCGDIVDELPLSQSTISQHLKELKEAGVITGTIEGPRVCYCIDAKNWEHTSLLLGEFIDSYTSSECC